MSDLLKAIASHNTPTSEGAWDGQRNESNLKKDQGATYYRKFYACVDPEGDAETKAAYKFIHHEVNADGKIGAASLQACSIGIAVLNGARGGTIILAADKKGVWDHLAKHLKDADQEPSPLRSIADGVEHRMCEISEIRTAEDDEGKHIEGYAAVFNKFSVPIYGFREKIAPGAFKKTIKKEDIRALFNHDDNFVLGRNTADTLELKEDKKGLFTRTTPPDTQWAKDLLVSIDRGDITGMSFQFRTITDEYNMQDGNLIRTLKEVKLYDISPVTFPAYPDTSVSVRALAYAATGQSDTAGTVFNGLLKLNAGEELTDEEIKAVRTHLDSLCEHLKAPDPEFKPYALALKHRNLDLTLKTL